MSSRKQSQGVHFIKTKVREKSGKLKVVRETEIEGFNWKVREKFRFDTICATHFPSDYKITKLFDCS